MERKNVFFSIGFALLFILAVKCERTDRHCCEYAIENECRKACLRSNSNDLLNSYCTTAIETDLFRCLERNRQNKRCCGMHSNMTSSCNDVCSRLFRAEHVRSKKILEDIKLNCPSNTFRCAKNYSMSLRTYSDDGMVCCDSSKSESCKLQCKRIMRQPLTDEEKIDEIIKTCGEPVPRKPLWKCLLSKNGELSRPVPPRVGPESQCCSKAISPNCKQLCKNLYTKPWGTSQNWVHFHQSCEYNQDESPLHTCLQELRQPCKIGCSGLQFCSNMNHRPTESFHSCNAVADSTASTLIRNWKNGAIRLQFAEIPVLDIDSCQPEKWKAVACILEVKPCGAKRGDTTICRNDCVSLLRECADQSRFERGLNIEWICDKFSPGHLQKDCISLDKYTVKGSNSPSGVITQPCLPNPCGENEVCVINRRKCQDERKCHPYECLPACPVGDVGNFLIHVGQRAKIQDFERGEGCYRACACTSSGKLEYCTSLPCLDEPKTCEVAGQIKLHGRNFKIDCNFCSCYNGEIICTKRQCLSDQESESRVSKALSCNCGSHILSVCASNGRTYPNICLAKCMGYSEKEIEFGPCTAKDPCRARPCKRNERCIRANRVCLTSSSFGCPQYECVAKYSRCVNRRTVRETYAGDGNHYVDNQMLRSASSRRRSSSLLFGYDVISNNYDPVCDVNGVEHDNICRLRKKHRNSAQLAYRGKCKSLCKKGKSQRVCGINGVTYENQCLAEAERLLVDYEGPCRFVPKEQVGDGEKRCADVTCKKLTHPECISVTSPGSCCPVCGGMLRILYSTRRLDSASEFAIHGPVSVRDVLRSLRRHTNVRECDLHGYLTTEGDIAVLSIPTVETPTLLQVEVCQQETRRIARLINEQNPIFHSDLVLSTLTAAEVHGTKDKSGAASLYERFSLFRLIRVTIILLLHMCYQNGLNI